jgi:hypothetical protein
LAIVYVVSCYTRCQTHPRLSLFVVMNIATLGSRSARPTQCRCGLCSIRLEESALANMDPFMFMAFMSQALSTVKSRVGEGLGLTTICLDLCWVSCRGVVRSLCINSEQRQLAPNIQQTQNLVRAIQIGHRYVDARRRMAREANNPQSTLLTLCPRALDNALDYVQCPHVVSVQGIMTRLRVVKISSVATYN